MARSLDLITARSGTETGDHQTGRVGTYLTRDPSRSGRGQRPLSRADTDARRRRSGPRGRGHRITGGDGLVGGRACVRSVVVGRRLCNGFLPRRVPTLRGRLRWGCSSTSRAYRRRVRSSAPGRARRPSASDSACAEKLAILM
eukprot:6141382-Prymnesium_polylepis.1